MSGNLQDKIGDQMLLTVKEAADLLNLKRAIVSRYCQSGRLPCQRFGPVYVIRKSDVVAFSKQSRKPGPKPKKSLIRA